MSEKQTKILTAVKDQIEIIETERYNSRDPEIIIHKNDPQEEIIVKILTSERTGAPLRIGEERFNSTTDLARRSFNNGVRTLNSWQLKKSEEYFSEAANLERDPAWQQRINLYKQLHMLLEAVIITDPARIIKSKGAFFEEVISFLPKYDLMSAEEQKHYRTIINDLYGVAISLEQGDLRTITQQLYIRCSVSLFNKEYLAAYIWLYKIYLINKEQFDLLAEKDKVLQDALKTLQLYIEVETGMKQIEDLPTIASAYDLQTIFSDHLTIIYDVVFAADTKDRFKLPALRVND